MCNRAVFAAAFAALAACCAAGTLEVKQVKNLGEFKENEGGASLKDATQKTQKTQKMFSIRGRLNKDEVGKCRIVVVPSFVSRSRYVTRITESYFSGDTKFSISYNYGRTRHSGAFFVFQAARMAEIPDGAERYEFNYLSPLATFNEEKWRYLGDWSNGFKLNGVAVYLIKVDEGKVKVLKTFCNAAIKDPLSRMKKMPKTTAELPNWALENTEYENICRDLDWSACALAPAPED